MTEGNPSNLDRFSAKVEEYTSIDKDTVKAYAPAAGALGIAGGILLFLGNPIKRAFNAMKNIPLIGGVFEALSDFGGLIVAGAAGLLAYKAFTLRGDDQPSFNTPNAGTGVKPQSAPTEGVSVSRPGALLTSETTQQMQLDRARKEKEKQNGALTEEEEKNLRGGSASDVEAARARALKEQAEFKKKKEELEKKQKEGVDNYGLSEELKTVDKEIKRLEEVQEAVRRIQVDKNQDFENRIQLIRDAREKNLEAKDGNPSAKEAVVKALVERIGLTPQEADDLVIGAPNLRTTVFPGADETQDHQGGNGVANGKATDKDGKPLPQATSSKGNMPQELEDFAHKFEDYYDEKKTGFFTLGTNSSAQKFIGQYGGYDSLSLTEKKEYIEKALEHVQSRHEKFGKPVAEGGFLTEFGLQPMGEGTVSPSRLGYDYTDRRDKSWGAWWAGYKEGSDTFPNGTVKTWKNEHGFLQALNGDKEVTTWSGASGPENGNGLTSLGGNFGNYKKLLDSFQDSLEKAETQQDGEIAKFLAKGKFMKQSLTSIGKGSIGIALLKVNNIDPAGKNVTIDIRDVKSVNPDARKTGDAPKYTLKGTLEKDASRTGDTLGGDILTVTEIVDESGKTIASFDNLKIDLNTMAGMDKIREQIDASRKTTGQAVVFEELLKKSAVPDAGSPSDDLLKDFMMPADPGALVAAPTFPGANGKAKKPGLATGGNQMS